MRIDEFTLHYKVSAVNEDWAAEHLQTIRTLMERAAVYRRALAPTVAVVGGAGIAGSVIGVLAGINSSNGFLLHWLAVACIALVGALVAVRRQALLAREPFWSPPARRVANALVPAFVAAVGVSIFCARIGLSEVVQTVLPGLWMVFYGCGLHAAGFFMPRGMRLFGWGFVVAGALWLIFAGASPLPSVIAGKEALTGHGVMGLSFGAGHLLYAVYLYLTERKNDA